MDSHQVTTSNNMAGGVVNWLCRALGLAAIALAFYLAYLYPVANIQLFVLLSVVVASYIYSPYSWLIYLPVLVVGLDLTSWSGRVFFTEFDFMLLALVGIAAFRGQLKFNTLPKLSVALCGLFIGLLILSFDFSKLWQAISSAHYSNPYHSELYAFKVTKGILWALLLAIVFNQLLLQSSRKALNFFIYGGWAGAWCLFVIILWERQTLGSIISLQPWWAIASSLLDLTSSYRVTAIFSDMHTGGEAIDGILLALIAINIFGVYYFDDFRRKLFSVTALVIVIYCVIVGFTRTTYVSTMLAIFVFVIGCSLGKKSEDTLTISQIFCGLLVVAMFCVIQKNAGHIGILSGAMIVAAAALGHWLVGKNMSGYLVSIALYPLAYYLSIQNHFNSKWITPTSTGLIILVISLITLTILGHFLMKSLVKKLEKNTFAITTLLLIAAAILVSLVLSGYQTNARLDTLGKDLDSRTEHWRKVIESSESSLTTILFGNGQGSFPTNYLFGNTKIIKSIGSFSINNNQLVLGTGTDLAFGQRVNIQANSQYEINLQLLAPSNGRLVLFFCERNLIFASNFTSNCSAKSINIDANSEYQDVRLSLNSKRVGDRTNPLARWPTTFYIKYNNSTDVIRINHLSLATNIGKNLLLNSNFEHGLDHWFFYNDYSHLPWHIKNSFLAVYYQLGVIGCLLIVSMFWLGITNLSGRKNNRSLLLYLICYLVAMLSFGLFGDPLDSPRASLIFYFTVFTAVLFQSDKINAVDVPSPSPLTPQDERR